MFMHYPWTHRWLLLNCSVTLNGKWLFAKILSLLRPSSAVNSYGTLLSQESRIQGCSVLSLLYMWQMCRVITINEDLPLGPTPQVMLFKDVPFMWLFQHLLSILVLQISLPLISTFHLVVFILQYSSLTFFSLLNCLIFE